MSGHWSICEWINEWYDIGADSVRPLLLLYCSHRPHRLPWLHQHARFGPDDPGKQHGAPLRVLGDGGHRQWLCYMADVTHMRMDTDQSFDALKLAIAEDNMTLVRFLVERFRITAGTLVRYRCLDGCSPNHTMRWITRHTGMRAVQIVLAGGTVTQPAASLERSRQTRKRRRQDGSE